MALQVKRNELYFGVVRATPQTTDSKTDEAIKSINPRFDPPYRIIQGDCFDEIAKLEDLSIHAVITDPPYGAIEFRSDQLEKMRLGRGGIWRLPPNLKSGQRKPLPRFSNLSREEKQGIQEYFNLLAECLFPKLVPGGHVIMASQVLVSSWIQLGFESGGFDYRGQIIRVYKTMRGGDRPKFSEKEMAHLQVSLRGNHEPWLVFRKPIENGLIISQNIKKWKAGALTRDAIDAPFADVIFSEITPKAERKISGHPTMKSQKLMRRLVKLAVIDENSIILDPFMGSGSTIAAANSLGIKSIGIELDNEFFNNAEKNIPLLSKISTK